MDPPKTLKKKLWDVVLGGLAKTEATRDKVRLSVKVANVTLGSNEKVLGNGTLECDSNH